jgi:hypothetical protein
MHINSHIDKDLYSDVDKHVYSDIENYICLIKNTNYLDAIPICLWTFQDN